MTDPYKVLGVNPGDSDETIKKAYRELVKKYHPDNYADTNLSDLASEKMKEINEAYDSIQKMRSGGNKSSSYSYNSNSYNSGGYSTNGGFDFSSYDFENGSSSGVYSDIRRLINSRDFYEAEVRLNSIPASERNAEWNYLKGCICINKGYFFDAQKYLESATYMDPDNREYAVMLQNLKMKSNGYSSGYRTVNNTGSDDCSACNMCQTLVCLDCLCECMGGDFIRCI